MTPKVWRARIGDDAFDRIKTAGNVAPSNNVSDNAVSDMLDQAVELGFRAPMGPPKITEGGTSIMWPGKPPMLTTEGLRAFYAEKGWTWFVLRVDTLLRAHAGPLAPRLQETLALYTGQCLRDDLSVVPDWLDSRPFAGGERLELDADLAKRFADGSDL